jgi:6-phosphofructokinase 1
MLATKLGAFAIEATLDGKTGVMAGEVAGQLVLTPLRETWEKRKPIEPFVKQLGRTLAT